jgi:hypothetical protein
VQGPDESWPTPYICACVCVNIFFMDTISTQVRTFVMYLLHYCNAVNKEEVSLCV